jgi:pilus assembly protein CpaB
MNLRPIILIALALVIAGLATLTAHRWMGNRIAPAETADTTRVVAAANDIAAGTRIDLTMIKMIEMPTASVPEQALRDLQAVVGQYAVVNLTKGEPILAARIAPQLGLSTLASRLGEGRRAITIGANELAGLTSYLAPGSRVDLLAAGLQGGSMDSRTLLQNLMVVAVDPPMLPDKYDPGALRSVTFEVDPQQAEQIVRATERSKLRMTLRNPDDRTSLTQDRQEPSIGEVAGREETPAEPQYKEITVIRGQASNPPVASVTRVPVLMP